MKPLTADRTPGMKCSRTFTILCTPDQIALLDALAKGNKVSRAEIGRVLINEALAARSAEAAAQAEDLL